MSQHSGLDKAEAECLQTEIGRLEEELEELQTVNYELLVETSELKERFVQRYDNSTTQ